MLAVHTFAQMTAGMGRLGKSHKRHPLACRRVTAIAADESDAVPMRIPVDGSVPVKTMPPRVVTFAGQRA